MNRKFFFKNQLWHFLSLPILIIVFYILASPHLGVDSFLNISDFHWFWLCILIPVTHQIIVWFVFRSQLTYDLFTRLFGRWDLVVWAIIFLPFLPLRFLSIAFLGLSNSGTLPVPRTPAMIAGLALLVPALYTIWSVFYHFGVIRAMGGDHFRARYRDMPLVREGAFRITSNAMYTLAFLALYSIALFTLSFAALIAALFQHIYVWVHYYCTEKPDMEVIYGAES